MGKTFQRIIILIFLTLQFSVAQDKKNEVPELNFMPILKSLIIPGTGEYSLQKLSRGRIFALTESALWVSVLGSYIISRVEQTKYQAFAVEHAGVTADRKEKQFWIDIGNYSSRSSFVQEHLRWREWDAVQRYDGNEWQWEWDSSSNRNTFETMRINSDRWALAGQFLIGGIVVNHIVSAIDVLYLQRVQPTKKVTFIPSFDGGLNRLSYSLILYF